MIFSTIEDKTSAFGVKIQSIFSGIRSNKTFGFGSDFVASLKADESALLQYKFAIDNGLTETEALKETMTNVSLAAREFAMSTEITGDAVAKFGVDQRMAKISTIAQNKSLSNVKVLLNEYNSGMVNCGLSQERFIEGVSKGNLALGKYLSEVDVGNAKMSRYILTLAGAKAATIGMRVATMALNMALTMGISVALSGLFSLVDDFIHREEKIIEKSKDAANAIKDLSDNFNNTQKTVTDISKRFAELAQGVNSLTGKNVSLSTEEYAEFLDLNNQLAELFPTLNRNYDENGNAIVSLSGDVDTIVGSLNDLVDVQRQVTNQQIVENLPDLYSGIIAKSRNFNDDIENYQDKIAETKKSYDEVLSYDFPDNFTNQFQGDILTISGAGESLEELDKKVDDYLQILDELGLKYEYLSEDYTIDDNGLEIPVGFNYRITNFRDLSDEEIAEAKSSIKTKLQELAAVYSGEMDKYSEGIKSSENQNKENWSSLLSSITAWLSTNTAYQIMSDDVQSVVQSMINNVDFNSLDFDKWEDVEKHIVQEILDPISNATPEVRQSFVDLFNLDTSNISFAEYKEQIEDGVKLIADGIGKDFKEVMDLTGFDTIIEKCEETKDKIQNKFNLSDAMINSLSPDEITNAWNYIENYGITSWGDLQKFIKSKKFSDSFNIDDIEALNEALDGLKGTYDGITGIIDDYNKNGYYTLENLKSLLELEPEYINALIDEKGQINLNSQAYKDYVAAKAKILVVDQIKSLYERILAMTAEEVQAYANATAYQAENGSLQDLITTTTQYYLILAKAKDAENGTSVYVEGLQKSFGTVANYAAVYDSWLNNLGTSTNEFSTSVKENTDALNKQKETLEDNKKALESYKDNLETAQNSLQGLVDLTVDYIKQTKEDEKEALEEQIKAFEKQQNVLNERKDKYTEVIDKQKEAIELARNEKKVADELADKQSSVAKSKLALEIVSLDDSSAGKKAQKIVKDELTENEKDLSDFLYDEAYDKQIADLDKQQEKFEEMINKQSTVIDAQVEHIESKIDEIDKYLNNSRQLYEDACAMIDNDTGQLYSKLWSEYVYPYTTKTKAEFDYLWSSAQTAIQKYRGDNQTLVGVMETLQGEIYTTETKIGELDSAIDNTSKMIDNTSTAIDNVSNSLSGLGSAITDYMSQLAELSNVDINPKPNSKKTQFYVTHNGKEYRTGFNYNGDTKSNRLLAAAELTKMIAKDVSGFDKYGLGIVQGYLGVGTSSAKQWYYDFQGKRYTAVSAKKENAISQILRQIEREYGTYPASAASIHGTIKHYASGTRSSAGGVSITQENGLEAIFGKLGKGKYTMMPEGSQVFDAKRTNNLYDFSGNPEEFISKLADKGLSLLSSEELSNLGLNDNIIDTMKLGKTVVDNSVINRNITNGNRDIHNYDNGVSNQTININMPIQIQGGADQYTVQAFNRSKNQLKNELLKEFVRIGEKYRR